MFLVNAFGSRRRLDDAVRYLDRRVAAAEPGYSEIRFLKINDSVRETRKQAGKTWADVRHAGLHVSARPHNKQMTLRLAKQKREHLPLGSQFRLVPRPRTYMPDYSYVERPDGSLLLTFDQPSVKPQFGTRYLVDRESKRVIERRYRYTYNNETREILTMQSSAIDPAAEIFFPRLMAKAEFKRDQLVSFDITLNLSVEIDFEVDDDALAVPVPAGWIVSDQRDKSEGKAVRMGKATPDIIQWALAN